MDLPRCLRNRGKSREVKAGVDHLCFDGTWNTPEDQTNVSRMYAAIADVHANCADQRKFYDPGVGTVVGTKLTGGALGWGLDDNILLGYAWLINEFPTPQGGPATFVEADGQRFHAGPDIFILGFSRGAYTARSLAGLINRCGLPRRELFREQAGARAGTKTRRSSGKRGISTARSCPPSRRRAHSPSASRSAIATAGPWSCGSSASGTRWARSGCPRSRTRRWRGCATGSTTTAPYRTATCVPAPLRLAARLPRQRVPLERSGLPGA